MCRDKLGDPRDEVVPRMGKLPLPKKNPGEKQVVERHTTRVEE
jgi:hypothetical protein